MKIIMGLDMYLTKKGSVKNWLHNEADNRFEVTITKGGSDLTNLFDNICYIESDVHYWRKANAIHRWFVDNVQHGVDDCKQYYVSHSDLVSLLEVINQVLDEPGKAHDLLPCQNGFFFGTDEYDEHYFSELKDTKDTLEREIYLAEKSGIDFEFYYQSSW